MESIIDFVDCLDILKKYNKEQLFLQIFNENKELKNENKELKNENKHFIENKELEKEINNLKKQNDELKNENNKNESLLFIKDIINTVCINELEYDNKNFKELNKKLENKNKELEHDNKNFKKLNKKLKLKNIKTIIFNIAMQIKLNGIEEELNTKLKELNNKLKEKNINLKKQIKEFDNKESDNEESDNKESDNEESDNEESDIEEFDNEESDIEEFDNESVEIQYKELDNKNKVLINENKELENENKELENENKVLENNVLENEILVINNNFLVNFENYLNQIINFYINITIDKIKHWYTNNGEELWIHEASKIHKCNRYLDGVDTLEAKIQQQKPIWYKEFVEHYQKILDDYRNKKFYIINSFNIFIKDKDKDIGFILFINNYGCVYGFNIIRDQWDKIICCNLTKFHFHIRYYDPNWKFNNFNRLNLEDIQINKYFLNNYTFDYQSQLSPNKIKLISNLPFNESNSKEINVLFSYLTFIYTNG
jgi:hypothetical protein